MTMKSFTTAVCWAGMIGMGLGWSGAPAYADPITDDKAKTFAARWIASENTPCNRVCETEGASAEHMLLLTSNSPDVYLCRVFGEPANRFGTNYADICQVENPGGQRGMALEPTFECLCLWRKQ